MKHRKRIKGFKGHAGMDKLAEDICNLRYDSLEKLLFFMALKLREDSIADEKIGHPQVSKKLKALSEDFSEISDKVADLWKICEKYM